jgi:hypothetical protein
MLRLCFTAPHHPDPRMIMSDFLFCSLGGSSTRSLKMIRFHCHPSPITTASGVAEFAVLNVEPRGAQCHPFAEGGGRPPDLTLWSRYKEHDISRTRWSDLPDPPKVYRNLWTAQLRRCSESRPAQNSVLLVKFRGSSAPLIREHRPNSLKSPRHSGASAFVRYHPSRSGRFPAKR